MEIERSDTVVIGGGVVGASIAYHLSKAGLSVVLVEKGGLTSGSSGACSGKIWLGTKQPGLHLRLAQRSLALTQRFIERTGDIVDCEAGGEMLLIESEAEIESMQKFVDDQANTGIDIRLMDRNETKEIQPYVSDDISGATYSPIGISVNPISLAYALSGEARRLGAKVYRNTEIQSIDVSSRRVQSVSTNRGRIKTDYVVNAAGSNAPHIGKLVGIEIPIIPLQGQIIITEAVAPFVHIPITEAGYIAVKRNPDLVKKLEQSGVTCGISQTKRGNIHIGASKQFVGHTTANSSDGIKTLARKAVRFFPFLSGVSMIRAFAGLRPYTSDGLPILGKVDAIRGLIMAAGHGGDGIALSMITGEIIENIITEKELDLPIDQLSLQRFSK